MGIAWPVKRTPLFAPDTFYHQRIGRPNGRPFQRVKFPSPAIYHTAVIIPTKGPCTSVSLPPPFGADKGLTLARLKRPKKRLHEPFSRSLSARAIFDDKFLQHAPKITNRFLRLLGFPRQGQTWPDEISPTTRPKKRDRHYAAASPSTRRRTEAIPTAIARSENFTAWCSRALRRKESRSTSP